ncbi:uncharacterized protein LOC130922059 isoform X2 [Corythoichthys intestinalis]|uniref:uncharacterized protein LOC130922059 isoform X2 n=1 Tax=Corythoichthys intestinalis TaxID=161448 RepID=UPI0025A5D811|nr:uncharacterized protein LOC130922059 isoform X2 [Corythoichthys intestinalis]
MKRILNWTYPVQMIMQGLILIFLLQFEAISGKDVFVYAGVGNVVTVPCKLSSCSNINWWYSKYHYSRYVKEVKDGYVLTSSIRSHRLSLKDGCSLLIKPVMAEDAGYFTCEPDEPSQRIFLIVMTLTRSPPRWDSGATGEGEAYLRCSFSCPYYQDCPSGKFRWLDEEGRQLYPERKRKEQSRYESFLKVRPTNRHSTYTCQYVNQTIIIVHAQYSPIAVAVNGSSPEVTPPSHMQLINIVRLIAAVLMLVIISALAIEVRVKSRRNAGQPIDS